MTAFKHMSVLCVEGQPNLQPIVLSVLFRLGFQHADVAADLPDASSALAFFSYDILLLDINGIGRRRDDLDAFLRFDNARARPLTILMVSSLGSELARLIDALPVDGTIRKPFTSEQLAAVIAQCKTPRGQPASEDGAKVPSSVSDDKRSDGQIVYL